MNNLEEFLKMIINYVFNFYLKIRYFIIQLFNLNVIDNTDLKYINGKGLKLNEEFNQLDTNKWGCGDYWGSGVSFPGMYDEQPEKPKNKNIFTKNGVKIKNNQLHLSNILEKYDYDNKLTFPLQSGKIYHKEPFKYGYFEIECSLPQTHSAWPAFWLTGYQSWPPEIDIFEFWTTNRPNKQVISLHHGSTEEDTYDRDSKSLNIKNPIYFNRYGCDWGPNGIDFYTNDILVYSYRPKEILLDEFRAPMYLILNNHVDNNDKNIFNAKYPNTMIVNYVKVYYNL